MSEDQYVDRGEHSLTVGGEVADCEARLLLYRRDIDIDAIGEALGATPTEVAIRGQRHPQFPRRPPPPVGRWELEAPSSARLEDQLAFLLDHTTDDEAVWARLSQEHEVRLSITLQLHSWTEGFVLPQDVVRAIGCRGWEFGVSIYGAAGGEVVASFLGRDRPSS